MKITRITRESTMTNSVSRITFILVVLLASTGCTTMSTETPDGKRVALAEQGYFFVGGEYSKVKDGQIMTGQMHVQYQIPQNGRSLIRS